MDWTTILIATAPVVGSIIVTAITFYFTKRHQITMDYLNKQHHIQMEWQKEKINHYKVLIAALSDLASDDIDQDEANKRFNTAFNSICLVAPEEVIDALMKFHAEVKVSNPNRTQEKHDELLRKLMLRIRKDIGLSGTDKDSLSSFHLIGRKLTKKS